MKKIRKLNLTVLLVTGLGFAAPPALAQSGKLHHIQSQTLLTFSSAETNLVYAALSAREFDMSLTNELIQSLRTSLRGAKKHLDKSTDLLSEKQEKLRPKFEKLRGILVTAERQLETLSKDVETQVKPFMDAMEGGDDRGQGEDTAGPPEPNWEALKKHVGWIALDLSKAQRLHRSLAGKIRATKLRTPRKPRGKRN